MARLVSLVKVSLITITVLIATAPTPTNGLSSVELGMDMATRAYDLVCWYEKLKQFPHTSSDSFTRDCFRKAEYVRKYIKDDETGFAYFGEWLNRIAMDGLPMEYRHMCYEYLSNPLKSSSVHEGDALNDGQQLPYPFQSFAYCLINQLRQKFGTKAIEAIKSEKTHYKKHWMTTILERQNEFRARHGSPPFKLAQELCDSAQRWADMNAQECKLYHSRNTDKDRRWFGNSTGESLSAGPYMASEDSAYIAADGWYEEIKDYPFPRGYHGNGNDVLFQKIGNFAQTVWKDTEYVGYGLAVNRNCDNYHYFLVARYSPAGNYIDHYQKNVQEPRDSRYVTYYTF